MTISERAFQKAFEQWWVCEKASKENLNPGFALYCYNQATHFASRAARIAWRLGLK